MRIVCFETATGVATGELSGNVVYPLAVPAVEGCGGLAAFLGVPERERERIPRGDPFALATLRLRAPVPAGAKIVCVATNFHEPARDGKPAPEFPLLFTRFPDSLVGHLEPLLKPAETERFDFEGEVAVVIGRSGHRIARGDALSHVAGYGCFNDGSARDWQKHSTQFTPGKNFFRSGAFGPFIVTADEIADPAAIDLETRVNGVVKQSISLSRFIFDIPWLVSYISTFTPLRAGDVIATGTPSGFGSTRVPPEFLNVGDIVEVTATGLGTLRNPVAAT